jgi:hypothetical protein
MIKVIHHRPAPAVVRGNRYAVSPTPVMMQEAANVPY